MQGTFHWLRVKVFCYATENEELIGEAMAELIGTDEIECDTADSEHGNKILILSCELLKQREFVPLFQRLGKELCGELRDSLEERIDDDCVLYLRLDKQELVQGRYAAAHHGDVLSLTGKIVSHPARKEIAVGKMAEFLNSLEFPEEDHPS
ncbi:MAG: exosome protein [Methanomassiliicoccaceae archaeon]|nr:exosome protein [Methanomassiliicoccaceae archaeon]